MLRDPESVLAVLGLEAADARERSPRRWVSPIDVEVRDQLAAEVRDNPLALVELSRVSKRFPSWLASPPARSAEFRECVRLSPGGSP